MTNLTGQHLIDGEWVAGATTFVSTPLTGPSLTVSEGTAEHVDQAAKAAEAAFADIAARSPAQHAALLRAIADKIDLSGDAITEAGTAETGLPAGRLTGERGRTVGQLRLFADHIETGEHLDQRHDVALPDRQPLPRSDLRLIQRPIGPIAVFGASNFPLAFSTAGGDTASALAAGCPVIVKGHPAHPATGEIVARAISEAVAEQGYPAATFQMVQGSSHALGSALVEHPLVCAVGFTGSLGAGRALFDLCARRPIPIPFFGELGSINPVFILPSALASRGADIAKAWAGSLTMGAGQFCTNPGLIVLPSGAEGNQFLSTVYDALLEIAPQPMLTDGIAEAHRIGRKRIASKIETILMSESADRSAAPGVATTDANTFLNDNSLAHEVFGPFGLVVRTNSEDEMLDIARGLEGQLTCTLQMDETDQAAAANLLPVLERKAGRILANAFPTGVEVSSAMVHGGPYPASTNFGHTSVGTMSIRRWLRPVCYQDIPESLLP